MREVQAKLLLVLGQRFLSAYCTSKWYFDNIYCVNDEGRLYLCNYTSFNSFNDRSAIPSTKDLLKFADSYDMEVFGNVKMLNSESSHTRREGAGLSSCALFSYCCSMDTALSQFRAIVLFVVPRNVTLTNRQSTASTMNTLMICVPLVVAKICFLSAPF